MVKGLIASLLIFSSVSFAETKTYNVKGMTCGGCVENVKSKVCTLKDIEKCEVEVGKVTVTSKNALDDKSVTDAITNAGYTVAEAGSEKAERKHGEGMACDHKDGKACEKCEHKDHASCEKDGECACKGKHKGHKNKKAKKS